MDNLTIIGNIVRKRSRRKEQAAYLTILGEWIEKKCQKKVKMRVLLRSTIGRKWWRAMIVHFLKVGDTKKKMLSVLIWI